MKACRRSERGQVTVEFLTVFGLLVLPFAVSAGLYYRLNWEKSKCVHQSFNEAREHLIATRQTASIQKSCQQTQERLTLVPLETLDANKGGLDLRDFQMEVSRSSAQFSSLQSPSAAPD